MMKDVSKSFEIITETVIEFVEGLECSKDIDSQLEAETIKAALTDTGEAIEAYMSKELPAKGQRMPETREQFERVAGLYDAALERERQENSRLRAESNRLRQKIEALKLDES